ncbi:MAG: hypothetical protein WCD18_24995 [Thermosynechococcaceae cyanobacterium]
MSDPQSTPRPKPAKPIKASERGPEAAAAESAPRQKERDKSKGKRRDRGDQEAPKASGNPALMRGPRPSQRKAEPEPEIIEEAVAVAEPEEPVAVVESEEPVAVVESEEPVAVAELEEAVAVAEVPQPQEV